MRPLMRWFAASLVSLLAVSCATSRPASIPEPVGADSLFFPSDSLEAAAYDNIYIELHAGLVKELGEREKSGGADTRLVEARSLVAASEELYLRGMFGAALRLLDEASRTLRQDH
jgi:hypothetical protein